MTAKLSEIGTPLRIVLLVFMVLTIDANIAQNRYINEGIEPGLGGLTTTTFLSSSLIVLLVDVVTSVNFKPRYYWIIQSVLIAVATMVLMIF